MNVSELEPQELVRLILDGWDDFQADRTREKALLIELQCSVLRLLIGRNFDAMRGFVRIESSVETYLAELDMRDAYDAAAGQVDGVAEEVARRNADVDASLDRIGRRLGIS